MDQLSSHQHELVGLSDNVAHRSTRLLATQALPLSVLAVILGSLILTPISAFAELACDLSETDSPLEIVEKVASCPSLPAIGSSRTGTNDGLHFGTKVLDAITSLRGPLGNASAPTIISATEDLRAISKKPVEAYGYGNAVLDLAACLAYIGVRTSRVVGSVSVSESELDLPGEPCVTWRRIRVGLLTEFDEYMSLPGCETGSAEECFSEIQQPLHPGTAPKPLITYVVLLPAEPSLSHALKVAPHYRLIPIWADAIMSYETVKALASMREASSTPLIDVSAPERSEYIPAWFVNKERPFEYGGTYGDKPILLAIEDIWAHGFLASTWIVLTDVAPLTGDAPEVFMRPDVINPESQGNWVTGYIETAGFDPLERIDLSKPILLDVIPAVSDPQYGWVSDPEHHDVDGNGQPELMVKFSREDVIDTYGEHHSVQLPVLGHYQDGLRFVAYTTLEFVEGDDSAYLFGASR